jgi:hypothetical protein
LEGDEISTSAKVQKNLELKEEEEEAALLKFVKKRQY